MSNLTLNEYQALLYRVATPNSSHASKNLNAGLSALHKIINIDLPELARKGSPDHFADILQSFQQELQRFRDFCAFPDLAQRNIIGIGGRFSAGKSSFINALLGKKLLNADVNPTTSLPTYLLYGQQNAIHAINLFQQQIELSEREFGSLTHEVQKELGSQVGAMLQSAHIQHTDFPWQNLAILDTPGYTKPETDEYSERTDERIAHAQLNSANYLLWLVSAEDGTISEDDLTFLSGLNPDIPRLVLVNKADKKTAEDVADIVAHIRQTLAERNIPVLDVLPVSSRRKDQYPLQAVEQYLEEWNRHTKVNRFARQFQILFLQYDFLLAKELYQTERKQLDLFNHILMLADNEQLTGMIEPLQKDAKNNAQYWKKQIAAFNEVESRFFNIVHEIQEEIGFGSMMRQYMEESDYAVLRKWPVQWKYEAVAGKCWHQRLQFNANMQLEVLDLSECKEITDLSPLAGLAQLKELDLSGCISLTDLSPLSHLICSSSQAECEQNHQKQSGLAIYGYPHIVNHSGVSISWCNGSGLIHVEPSITDFQGGNMYFIMKHRLKKSSVEMQMSELKQIVAENSRGADWAKIVLEHYALCYDPNNGMNTNWKPEFDITFIEVIDVSKLRNDVVYYHPRSNITFKLGVDPKLRPYHAERAEYFEAYQFTNAEHKGEFSFRFVINDRDVNAVAFRHLWLCSFKKPIKINITNCRYSETGLYVYANGEEYDYLTLSEVNDKIGTVFSVDENGYVSYQTESYLQKEKVLRNGKRNCVLENDGNQRQRRGRKIAVSDKAKWEAAGLSNTFDFMLLQKVGLYVKF